jgi:isopenicillin N synthase-like dioxygenase
VDFNEAWDNWGKDALDESKYPSEVPGLKGALEALRPILSSLTQKFLRAFGVILKLEDPNALLNQHKALADASVPTNTLLRSYYFPSLDADVTENTLRLSNHCMWGSLVLFFQDSVDGFEVREKGSEAWAPVKPVKGSILVCPGLSVENWSGGHFPAPVRTFRQDHKYAENSIPVQFG